jgi:hypothetical protein
VMQLRPPGTPLAQVTGGTAIARSFTPAKAVETRKPDINPTSKMEDIRRMGMILPWPRILRERPMGPRTIGCNGSSSLVLARRSSAQMLRFWYSVSSSTSPQCSGFWVAQRSQRCGEGFVLLRALAPELSNRTIPANYSVRDRSPNQQERRMPKLLHAHAGESIANTRLTDSSWRGCAASPHFLHLPERPAASRL